MTKKRLDVSLQPDAIINRRERKIVCLLNKSFTTFKFLFLYDMYMMQHLYAGLMQY